MASTRPEPGSNDQQVMPAQSTNTPPQGVDTAVAHMDGETAGPDYERQQRARPMLPNGVLRHSPASPEVDMQSLPYSPLGLQAQGSTSGLLAEAWPAQPQAAEASRSEAEVPAAMRWMHRLGDFLRQHTAMEFTTTTRRQITGSSGNYVVQQQVQHTASRPSTPPAPSMGTPARPQEPPESDPPLFGRGALRTMEAWPRQAPLLHGGVRTSTGTDDASSVSIPREMVEAEVKRQVQDALRSQQQGLEDLREENRRLRIQISQGRDVREAPSAVTPEVHVDDQIHMQDSST